MLYCCPRSQPCCLDPSTKILIENIVWKVSYSFQLTLFIYILHLWPLTLTLNLTLSLHHLRQLIKHGLSQLFLTFILFSACPNQAMPYLDIFCGRGLNRQDCPAGWTCNVHQADAWAVCCPESGTPNDCEVTGGKGCMPSLSLIA